ncbi:MAG: VWA domain-containing protein, partial [Caldilineaceae bacterium]|nr:VWA domain-containing protein [Caldilineaceae bacterium]
RFSLELETMEAGGYTGLVDAVLEAHAALQQSGDAGAVNVIVVLSDGRDNDSESKLRNLHRAMGEGPIPVLIHTIGYGGDANERLLRELARIGDGQFHRAEGVDIEGLYRLIATHDLAGN